MLAAISCGRSEAPASGPASQTAAAGKPYAPDDARNTAVAPSAPKIVALGDSLTAGLGVPRDEAYPAVLQRKLEEAGITLEVVNAGVSGDTTADGLRRATWALEGDVRLLIVALGANDGLR